MMKSAILKKFKFKEIISFLSRKKIKITKNAKETSKQGLSGNKKTVLIRKGSKKIEKRKRSIMQKLSFSIILLSSMS